VASRNESFRADDETNETLRSLGYSEEEIGATAGQLPSEMEQEEKLRLSLRALSAEHATSVQQRAEAAAPPFNPKVHSKQDEPPQDNEEAYRRGRSDERYLRRNDPNYVPPTKPPRAQRQRQPRAVNWGRLYRKSGGKWK
jgi:hypothetical protein